MRSKLTAKQVEQLTVNKGQNVRRVSDGEGLVLVIRKSGAKSWEFRFVKPNGRPSNLGLGRYPQITLTEARRRAAEFRRLRALGKDPSVEQRKRKLDIKREAHNTVQQIAELWLETASSRVATKTATGFRQKLRLHIYPKLGRLPIQEVKASMLIEAMKPLERDGKLETIGRTVALFRRVMATIKSRAT
ncbi:tyrosine-type recombinase/integrase [Vibrio hangzhouensis]|uniref:tyrosine-type recombinase/integrase n=1 Tax=Vibrio hangzhouensis TaxID=462991 RepID=UPI001C986642|nr:integrase arm-type DNA-binding domain-containing protein [Vibrio hangzhouensis]MBY6197376.1 integrase arm-type DNA-binding domain-containing protein [Vibrio hangzhouensis]